jgi:circadian clock protein KaiB
MAIPTYVLQIFVAGEKGRSRSAVENLRKICEKELSGQYKIEVVDVSKNPRAAVENNLTALPAVFRTLPSPVRKFVGNWANEDHELVGFELVTQDQRLQSENDDPGTSKKVSAKAKGKVKVRSA